MRPTMPDPKPAPRSPEPAPTTHAKATLAGGAGLAGALLMFLLSTAFGAGRDVSALQAEVAAAIARLDRVEAKLDAVLLRHKQQAAELANLEGLVDP